MDGLTVRDIAVKLTAPDLSMFAKAEKQVLTFLERQWLPSFFSNRDPKHVSFGVSFFTIVIFFLLFYFISSCF